MDWNAYHFTGKVLRDGSPVPGIGEKLRFGGEIELCESGYHFSRKAWQALEYAPGDFLHRVQVGGHIIEPTHEDKGVASERTIIATIHAEPILRDFARSCARDVVHLWNAPDVVRQYLERGDEGLRDAARNASRNASRDAARDAAWAAALSAARDAARCAACDAAWAAACDAAWAAAKKRQRARFTRMVNAAFEANK